MNLKTELQRIYEAKGKGAILRSKVRWVEQGEKPTKYFFNLEKGNFNRKVITEIKREDGKTVVEEHEILKEIESFYSKLYASQVVDNNEAFSDFTCDWLVFSVQNTLNFLNFGDGIKRWVSTFYTGPESAVLNNGFSTNYFELSRGVRQGCPLSPYLFILGAEILACKIRQDKEIQGIRIFNSEAKISQFADDTSLICKSCHSVEKAIEVLDSFGNFSGLRLNTAKTKALWLGPWHDSEEKPFGFKWPKEPVRALGIFISYDERQNNKKNFLGKIDKLGAKLEVWCSRNLSILGRCLITKCLGIPQLVFSMSILDGPKNCIPTINTSIFQFIWKKRKDKIKRQVMYQNYDKGGLRVPNVDVMIKSPRLAWIPRLLSNDEKWSEVWKTIPNHYFDSFGGLNFLLRCNSDLKFLEQTNMPQFYKSMLQFFHELKSSYETDLGQDFILFNNKDILIDHRTFFYKPWFKKGIFRVHDLLTECGTFFSHGEFTKRYNLNCHFLQYLQVVSAIPKRLLEKAKQNQDPKFTFSQNNTFFQLSSTIKVNLLKSKSKDYYWLFINKANPELKAPKKWARDLQFNHIELSGYFKNLKSICKENNLREFYFKFLHRIIVTRKYRVQQRMRILPGT